MQDIAETQFSMDLTTSSQTGSDKIGCCARYRECSDAMKCICPNPEVSSKCSYRSKLEMNQIYYGKNASDFSAEAYGQICSIVDGFSDKAKYVFYSLIYYLRGYSRGSTYRIVRREFADSLTKTGLFNLTSISTSLPYLCSLKKLRNLIRESEYAESFKSLEETYKKNMKASDSTPQMDSKKKDKGSYVQQWMNNEGRTFRDHVAAPYMIAFIRPEQLVYIEELYYDMILTGYRQYGYPMSPLAEDGLLTPMQIKAEKENAKRGVIK